MGRARSVLNIAVSPLVEVQSQAFPRGTRDARVVIDAPPTIGCATRPTSSRNGGPHPRGGPAAHLSCEPRSTPPPPCRRSSAAAPPGIGLGVGGTARRPRLTRRRRTLTSSDCERGAPAARKRPRAAIGRAGLALLRLPWDQIDIVDYPHADVQPLGLADDILEVLAGVSCSPTHSAGRTSRRRFTAVL